MVRFLILVRYPPKTGHCATRELMPPLKAAPTPPQPMLEVAYRVDVPVPRSAFDLRASDVPNGLAWAPHLNTVHLH
jgi:hypothetical protein